MSTSNPKRRSAWPRRLAIAWLIICAIGQMHRTIYPRRFFSAAQFPSAPVVQLRSASIPCVRLVGDHCFLASYDPNTGRWQRWEVWQEAEAGGASWGHVHLDLMGVDTDVGGGPVVVVEEWRGDAAHRILDQLRQAAGYRYRDQYVAWPGPNSNTFPASILREARVAGDLGPKSVGKDYIGWFGARRTPDGLGFQVALPLVGWKVGLEDGIELHVLALTWGIDVWPPALKTPFGRFGFENRPLRGGDQ